MSTPSSTGPLIAARWMPFAEPASRLHATNPFEPRWDALEKAALGDRYRPGDGKNRERLRAELAGIVAVTAQQLTEGVQGTAEELAVYQGLVFYNLWDDHGPALQKLVDTRTVEVPFWEDFERRYRSFLGHPGLTAPEPGHLLALLYQAQRTWHFVGSLILGDSALAQASRAALWRASMGGDACVYAEGLYRRMDEIPVLITGETGTGKDLAARCIGWTRYIPFDVATRRFATTHDGDFHVRNLCEIPDNLLESALFGHKRGSFTGATADKQGYFALPRRYGTLFLDEAGELSREAQPILLRPLQNREYVPLGETRPREIHGRTVFATNVDLEAMCREKTFRRDLYERMNGVRVHMPSLREILAEAPGELRRYVRAFVAAKVDNPARVEALTERVVAHLHATRPNDAWLGNLRELQNYTTQYVVTDGHVSGPAATAVVAAKPQPGAVPPEPAKQTPPPTTAAPTPESTGLPSSAILGPEAKAGRVTFVQLVQAYIRRMFRLARGNTAEAARLTGLDRRTVLRWLDPVYLARWLRGRK